MASKCSQTTHSVLVIYLEEKHRELVASQFSGTLETSDVHTLYRAFVEDTINACLGIETLDLVISYAAGPGERIVSEAITNLHDKIKAKCKSRPEENRLQVWQQPELSLSESLAQTFKKCFDFGYEQVLLIDCVTPTISHRMLESALCALKRKDVVFGPTLEGSYYLVGMRRFIPQIFTHIDWSQDEHIYSRIVEVAREDGLDWEELELWYDLRQPDDLEYLVRDINAFRIVGDEASAKRTETVLESLIQKFQDEGS